MNDILNSGLEFRMLSPTLRYFEMEQYSTDRITQSILAKNQLCDTADGCLSRIATKRYGWRLSHKIVLFSFINLLKM